jgi:hypothetical protein
MLHEAIHLLIVSIELYYNLDFFKVIIVDHHQSVIAAVLVYDRFLLSKLTKK